MQQFIDSAGSSWVVKLDIAAAKRVRDIVNVDILAPESGDIPLQTRIGTDVILMIDIIYAIIEPQLTKADITDAAFGERLGGDVIVAAQNALYAEMILFFLACGRRDRATALEKQKTLIDMSIERAQQEIEAIDPKQKIAEIFGKLSTQ